MLAEDAADVSSVSCAVVPDTLFVVIPNRRMIRSLIGEDEGVTACQTQGSARRELFPPSAVSCTYRKNAVTKALYRIISTGACSVRFIFVFPYQKYC